MSACVTHELWACHKATVPLSHATVRSQGMVQIMFTFTRKGSLAFHSNVYTYCLKGHICGTLFYMDLDWGIQNSSGCLSPPACIHLNASWEVVSSLGARKDGRQVQNPQSRVPLLCVYCLNVLATAGSFQQPSLVIPDTERQQAGEEHFQCNELDPGVHQS